MQKRYQDILQLVLLAAVLVIANVLGTRFYTSFDMTEEKRYTLTPPTRELLASLRSPITVEVYLDGDFPAGFKRLQNAVREMLEDFRAVNGYVEYEFINPNEGSTEDINAYRQSLAELGMEPVNLRTGTAGEKKQTLIFPWALFRQQDRTLAINFLENERIGASPEEVLNTSISLLEYKFADAIQKLLTIPLGKPIIGFTTGHGELPPPATRDLEKSLTAFYNTLRIDLDSIISIPVDTVPLVIVAKPLSPFTEKQKFKLDQYLMRGGKIIWMIDRLRVSLDSLRKTGEFIPPERSLNLDDLLFKYGIRLPTNMVLDLQCSPIPQVIGNVGGRPQLESFPWYYHPVVIPRSDHPIVKGLDGINFFFPSSIDTVSTPGSVTRTVLLTSSDYSRVQFLGSRVSFEILKYEPDPSKFNKPHQLLAVLQEGTFESLYANRVTASMAEGMERLGLQVRPESEPSAAMVVVSDGDLAANLINPRTGEPLPLGFNRYDQYTYANKEFLLNTIEYLLDKEGVFEARAKEVKLRLLNTVKAQEELAFWRFLNIGLPLVLLALFGWTYQFLRNRKYRKKQPAPPKSREG